MSARLSPRSMPRGYDVAICVQLCPQRLHSLWPAVTHFIKPAERPATSSWTTAAEIGQVRYVNILPWFRGFQDKLLYLVLFSLYPGLLWELGDKRNLTNLQFWPESLGAMLEYWYIERGLSLAGSLANFIVNKQTDTWIYNLCDTSTNESGQFDNLLS